MRILMLAQFYPPIIGGEERHVRNLSRALVARGHSVAVATHSGAGLADFEEDAGVRIYRIGGTMQRLSFLFTESGRRHAPPFPDPETTLALREIIQREKPDVVHAHNWLVHSFLPIKGASNAKLVMTLHDYSLVCAQKRLLYHEQLCEGPAVRKCVECAVDHYGAAKGVITVTGAWVMRQLKYRAVDMFVPVSHSVADKSGLTGTDLPYEVIPNFVPDDVATLQSESTISDYADKLPRNDFLLYVGDLTRDKGIDVLLQSYSEVVDPPPLVLIGRRSPETPSTLPPNVMIFENWPHPAVMEAWRRSMLGVVPSVCADSCPTVVIEAMAAGRPVIGSRIGGLTDLVADGETGLLVEPNSVSALREALSRMLTEGEMRERMAVASAQRVREFQAMTVVPRIEALYQQMLNPQRVATASAH